MQASTCNPQALKVACYSRKQAFEYITKSYFGRALAHLFVTLHLVPEWRDELRSSFLQALDGGCKQLEDEGRLEETIQLRKDASLLYPEDGKLLMSLGSTYFKLKDTEKSLYYFHQAIQVCPSLLPASHAIQSIYNKEIERWHFRMLNDACRNEAYHQAIAHRVQEGYTSVLDVGTGTGLLSLFASELGAEKIWACESNTFMYKIAQSVLAANNVSGKINLIKKHSNLISIPGDIPERVSLIVTEVFDAGLLGEGVISMLLHAWENFLLPPGPNTFGKQTGVVIPFSATVYAAAIQCINIARRHRLLPVVCSCYGGHADSPNETSQINFGGKKICKFCEGPCDKFDMSEDNVSYHLDGVSIACDLSEPYTSEDLENIPYDFEMLSKPHKVLKINFNNLQELKDLKKVKEEVVSLLINSAGCVDAVASWFHLNLDNEGTIISTAPFKESGLHQGVCWHQAIFPSLVSKKVTPGDVINLNVNTEEDVLKLYEKEKSRSVLVVSEDIVRFLNNKTWIKALRATAIDLVNKFSSEPTSVKGILDLNPFPILGLQMLKGYDSCWKLIAKAETKSDEEYILAVARKNSIDAKQIQFVDNEFCKERPIQESFDVICLNIMNHSGEFRESSISVIAHVFDKLSPNGTFVPFSLNFECQLIESERLIEDSRVVSDERMRNFNITEYINDFIGDYHLDVPYNGFKFRPLSDCFKAFQLGLHPLTPVSVCGQHEENLITQATGNGTVTGIIYWVNLVLQPGKESVSSACVDSHCNQGVILSSFDVNSGMEVSLKSKFWYGLFDIRLSNAKT